MGVRNSGRLDDEPVRKAQSPDIKISPLECNEMLVYSGFARFIFLCEFSFFHEFAGTRIAG